MVMMLACHVMIYVIKPFYWLTYFTTEFEGDEFWKSFYTGGAFKNYVDQFLPYFDHLPTSG